MLGVLSGLCTHAHMFIVFLGHCSDDSVHMYWQVVNATRNGDVTFCKAFWSLAENSFMHVSTQ